MVLFTSITPLFEAFTTGKVTSWDDLMKVREEVQKNQEPLFEFGTREPVKSDFIQELYLGFFVTLPCALILGRLLLFVTTRIRLPFLRGDLQHAVISTAVGDLLLELLLPSLKCYPTATMFKSYVDLSWVRTMWGQECFVRYSEDILTPHGTFYLLGIRTLFLIVGLFFSQGFCPVALTGGIATGKSTMAKLLAGGDKALEEFSNEGKDKKEEDDLKKPQDKKKKDSMDEGISFYLVDCDAIGHEILLSPATLKGGKYSVYPGESVYKQVCAAFASDDILDKKQEIDRTKLGTLIFADDKKRATLNKLTHSRIAWILWKRLMYGCYLSGKDVVLAEVPLLFETKSWMLRSLFCLTVMVTVESTDVQRQRLQARNPNMTAEECDNRLKAQMPLKEKAKRSSYVLYNGNDREQVVKDLQTIQQACVDRIHGVGISVMQIVAIVIATLIAGLMYQIHVKGAGGEEGAAADPLTTTE